VTSTAERYAREVGGYVSVEEVTLERMRWAVTEYATDEFLSCLERAELESYADQMMARMVYHLRGEVLAEKLMEETIPVHFAKLVYLEFPTSPWQFFKQRHPRIVPYWFRRRWPVKTTWHEREVRETRKVRLKQFAMFPASPIRTPEKLRGPVVIRREEASVDS
jgi:hypothetical protein